MKPEELSKIKVNTQALVNKYSCDGSWINDNNLVDTHLYDEISGDLTGIVGIAVNGVPIHHGTSAHLYDAFFPQTYGQNINPSAVSVDACLGIAENAVDVNNDYYYYFGFSPCMFETSTR